MRMDLKKKFKLFAHKQDGNTTRFENEQVLSNKSNDFSNQIHVDTAFDNLIKEAYTQHHYKSTENPNEENDVINNIEKVLFQSPESFDACIYSLKNQEDKNFNIDNIYAERSKLRFQLHILSKKISSLILEKSHLYTTELAKVQNLQKDLKLAIDATKESRKNLQSTLTSLSLSCLILLKNNQHNINATKVTKQLHIIKDLYQSDIYLRQNLEQKDFYGAIKLCLESRKELIKFSYYKCLSDLNNKIQDTLDMTEEQMDVNLAYTTSYQFGIDDNEQSNIWGPNGLYKQLFKAQSLLGKTHTALDQLHMHYTTTIHNKALEVVREFVNIQSSKAEDSSTNPFDFEYSKDTNVNLKKYQYPDLCLMLDSSQYLACLNKLLFAFHNLLLCYYTTVKWYQDFYNEPDEEGISSLENEKSHNALEEDFTRNYIFQKLKHGVIRIWQDVQQKIHLYLITIPDIASMSYGDLVKLLLAVLNFLKIGKDFSDGRSSQMIESSLKQATLKFLQSYHSSRMEELKMFMENESWKRCPVKRNFKYFQLQEFGFMKKNPNATDHLEAEDQDETEDLENQLSPNLQGKEKLSLPNVCLRFDKYTQERNPFAIPKDSSSQTILNDPDPSEAAASPSSDEDEGEEGGYTESGEDDVINTTGERKRINPALNSLTPHSDKGADGRKVQQFLNRRYLAPILTNSALTIFRLTGELAFAFRKDLKNRKYLQISSIYPAVTTQVMGCIAQLYDIYLFTVYQIVIGKNHYQMVGHLLSEQLLSKITGIRENFFNRDDTYPLDFPKNYEISTTITCPVKNQVPVNGEPPTSGPQGCRRLTEDYCVAVESLAHLGVLLGAAITCSPRPLSRDFTPFDEEPKVDPLAAEILRVACYIISLYVIDYTEITYMIGSETKWDIKELMSNHSSYINYIIRAYRNFASQLVEINTRFNIPKEFYDTLWQNLISVTFRTIVDGYSNIRRCSNEGRALMQLDLQHLLLNVEDLIGGAKEIPDKEFIENYIKAYYMPETEIESWIANHQEYSYKHLSSLVNTMNHLTKKTRTRILTLLEDPERRNIIPSE